MSNEFEREERCIGYIAFEMSDLVNSLKGDEIRKLAREYAEQLEQLGKKTLAAPAIAPDPVRVWEWRGLFRLNLSEKRPTEGQQIKVVDFENKP